MDIKGAQEALRRGVTPSPDYPDLPNDFTAAELIAFDPKAELEYRMAKDRHPGLTRAMLMQHWRPFRIGHFGLGTDGAAGKKEGFLPALIQKAAEILRKPSAAPGAEADQKKRGG